MPYNNDYILSRDQNSLILHLFWHPKNVDSARPNLKWFFSKLFKALFGKMLLVFW